MKIFSPSYKRALNNVAITHKYISDVTYVVTEDEKDDYLNIHDKVISIPNGNEGKIEKCNWVLDKFQGEQIVLLDDDIKKIGLFNGNKSTLLSEQEVYELIDKGFLLCKDFGFKMWGVNCATDKGSYREYTPFATTSFIGGPFHAHIECGLRYDIEMNSKDDYDMNIQQMDKHRGALRLNMYHTFCDMAKSKGGYAETRTVSRELQLNDKLQQKWGDKIIRFDTSNKSGKQKTFDINPIIKIPIKGV